MKIITHAVLNIFFILKYNQQVATLHNVFISAKCFTCFRRVLRPSSGAQNCINSIGYLSGFAATCLCRGRVWTTAAGSSKAWQCPIRQRQVAAKPDKYPMLCIQFWAPDDGRRTRLKRVEHFTEINILCNFASCWLYLKIHLRCTDTWMSKILNILCKSTITNVAKMQTWRLFPANFRYLFTCNNHLATIEWNK
jgi:hypothetical protein